MTDAHDRAPTGHRGPAAPPPPGRRPAVLALLLLAACNSPVPPVAQDREVALAEDTSLSERVAATDVDSPSVTYDVAAWPAHGTLAFDVTSGAFTYRPTRDYNGPDEFKFVASDGRHASSLATVFITVKPVNDPPVLAPLPDLVLRSKEPGAPIAIDATDVDGDPLSYEVIVAEPGTASAFVEAPGSMVVTGFAPGMATVTTTVLVTASDGALQASRTFTLTVLPPPPEPPANLLAEPRDGEVNLAWTPSPGALWYDVRWTADPQAPLDQYQLIADVPQTSLLHGGLANLTTYRYVVHAIGEGGASTPSLEVMAEPGPVPGPVTWTVAVGSGTTDTIHWTAATNATSYRVYFADAPDRLTGRTPVADFVEATSAPAEIMPPGRSLGVPAHYRVLGLNGSRIGTGGPVAASTIFSKGAVVGPYVTPALWDVDGDGCLDMVGGRGDCSGGFAGEPLEQLGLAGLFAAGRTNRDSRFADFNGDGFVDIYTNVYSRADDPASSAILHLNDGTGHFTEDPGIAAMHIGGFGETVLAADFNNDGFVDLFDPHYWHRDDGGRNWLLMNDGRGHFVDRAIEAGLASAGPPAFPYIPEGAQALDFDIDGWVDVFVASHLFINNRDGTFRDAAAEVNLPAWFDEGASFVDLDQDGDFDYLLNSSNSTVLFRNVGGRLGPAETIESSPDRYGYGFATCDVNGDDFPDIVVARNDPTTHLGSPTILLNLAGTFVPTDAGLSPGEYVDLVACADLDGNGSVDLMTRWPGLRVLRNGASNPNSFNVRVLGPAGERNQQGHVVHVRPLTAPGKVFARVVESGSGYMAQGNYDLHVGAAYPGAYEITAFFDGRVVQASTTQGADVTIYADGRVVVGLH